MGGLEEAGRSLRMYCSIPGRRRAWLGIGLWNRDMDGFKYILEIECTRFVDGLNVAHKGKAGIKAISQVPGHLQ